MIHEARKKAVYLKFGFWKYCTENVGFWQMLHNNQHFGACFIVFRQ